MKRTGYGILALATVFSIPLQATTVRRLSLDELVAKADSIIVGRVIGSHTFWTNDRKLILTSYTLEVQQSLKGSAAPTIVVTTIGGQMDTTLLQVPGMPAFENNESAVLFLVQSGGYATVLGLKQGKFAIANDEVSSSLTGLSFPDGLAGKPVKMSLEEFKRQIQLRVGN
jgi:hypothetical protein